MTADPRSQAVRRTVLDVVGFESEVAETLEQAQKRSAGYPDAIAVIQGQQSMVRKHRDELAAYLEDSFETEPGGVTAIPRSASRESPALSEALLDLCLAHHRCALGYTILYEVALRLYEPRLREIAPEHLKAHVDAALSTARLLPGVVAWQLAQEELLCACICPMCGLGACGCVALGTDTLIAAWREANPTHAEPDGFVLQPPRPESALAGFGVQGGDMLLAVDGLQVSTTGEIQQMLRQHALGEEVRLLVRHNLDTPRELLVRHVSDYPKS